MRQHSRVIFRAANRLRALDHHTGELLGMVADLSRGGLRLLTEQSLEAGKVYAIDLEVPISSGRFRVLELQMICQWNKRNGRLGRFEQGFALAEPAPEFATTVDALKLVEERSRSLRA
ncbi:PilZ domain-containing protein [Pseudomonas sp. Gutcm_11s]|uniref:PilZ domain-containing protein n=1 Tax=Pseudomonas sp. Gutcm_11s TaxID=3026088 RepID=UPI00235FF429|nr:PilZ domain-containing protein [Pseudomonas sp. Gutcm_11s]MDD0841983.1 PilZ domain-containing protein [Pseudomonas sp. Gutcm_11s]